MELLGLTRGALLQWLKKQVIGKEELSVEEKVTIKMLLMTHIQQNIELKGLTKKATEVVNMGRTENPITTNFVSKYINYIKQTD